MNFERIILIFFIIIILLFYSNATAENPVQINKLKVFFANLLSDNPSQDLWLSSALPVALSFKFQSFPFFKIDSFNRSISKLRQYGFSNIVTENYAVDVCKKLDVDYVIYGKYFTTG